MLRAAIESTKIANRRTDVGVVDIAVDVVCANRLRMQPPRHRIRSTADGSQVVRLEQSESFLGRESLARNRFVEDGLDHFETILAGPNLVPLLAKSAAARNRPPGSGLFPANDNAELDGVSPSREACS